MIRVKKTIATKQCLISGASYYHAFLPFLRSSLFTANHEQRAVFARGYPSLSVLPKRISSMFPRLRSVWTRHHSVSHQTLWRRYSSSFIFIGSNVARGVGTNRMCFMSIQICFLFTVGSSSSPCCARALICSDDNLKVKSIPLPVICHISMMLGFHSIFTNAGLFASTSFSFTLLR